MAFVLIVGFAELYFDGLNIHSFTTRAYECLKEAVALNLTIA